MQPALPTAAEVQVATQPDVGGYARRGADDPLSTVGLALLAYGLVQLLSKIIDKVALGKGASDHRPAPLGSFTDEDRKRLERACELVANGDQRLQRIGEAAATQQKLVGQVLDELREAGRKQEQVVRRVNAVWNRIGSRNDDGR